ncbi:MAG: hypothetical protein ACRD5J_13990, partial [Nitrososphaeraceae archaeon]
PTLLILSFITFIIRFPSKHFKLNNAHHLEADLATAKSKPTGTTSGCMDLLSSNDTETVTILAICWG